jgi:hypothetical protein
MVVLLVFRASADVACLLLAEWSGSSQSPSHPGRRPAGYVPYVVPSSVSVPPPALSHLSHKLALQKIHIYQASLLSEQPFSHFVLKLEIPFQLFRMYNLIPVRFQKAGLYWRARDLFVFALRVPHPLSTHPTHDQQQPTTPIIRMQSSKIDSINIDLTANKRSIATLPCR